MNIGTPVSYTDPRGNNYAGIVCGFDFRIGPVWRAPDGTVRRNPDGSPATARQGSTDTVANEPIDTGLVNVFSIFRDGQTQMFVVDPVDLADPESFTDPLATPRPHDPTPPAP